MEPKEQEAETRDDANNGTERGERYVQPGEVTTEDLLAAVLVYLFVIDLLPALQEHEYNIQIQNTTVHGLSVKDKLNIYIKMLYNLYSVTVISLSYHYTSCSTQCMMVTYVTHEI